MQLGDPRRDWILSSRADPSVKLRYQIVTFLYAAAVFWLLCVPDPLGGVSVGGWLLLVVHAGLFAGMAGIITLGIVRSRDSTHPVMLFLIPAVAASLYGLLLEIVQVTVPLRAFEWQDVIANMAGVALMESALAVTGRRVKLLSPKLERTREDISS